MNNMAGYNPYDFGGYYPQYNNQYQNYQQPQYNMYQGYQQQQPQQQINYAPLTYVNGIEGAKAYIVAPNQIVYLKDSDSNTLFEKKADAQGKYSLSAFELTAINIEDIGKKAPTKNDELKSIQEQLDKITALLEARGEE